MTNLTMEAQPNQSWAESASPNIPAPTPAPSSQSFDLESILNIVRRGWYKILLCILGGWILAGAYFVVAPPTYESKAQLYVMRKDSSLATRGVTTGSETDSSVSGDLLATQIQILQSRKILKEVANRPEIFKMAKLQEMLKEGDQPVDYIIDNLSVSRGGGGQARDARVLNISFKHDNPEEAKVVLDGLLDVYKVYLKNKFQDVNKDAAVLINQARSELETELNTAETNYRKFREDSPVLWSGDESSNIHRLKYETIQQEIGNVDLQISEVNTRLVVVNEAIERQKKENSPIFDRMALIDEKNAQRMAMMLTVQQSGAETANFVANQPGRVASSTLEYGSVMELVLLEKTLQEKYGLGENHPEVAAIRGKIETAKDFLKEKSAELKVSEEQTFGPEQVIQAYVTLLQNDLIALQERKKQLLKNALEEEGEAKKLVKFEMDGVAMQDRISRQKALYETVVDRLREINLATDYGGIINDVIATPESGKGVWPKLPICLAIGTLLGMFFGGLSTAATEFRDRSFRSTNEVREALNTTLLSHLPNLSPVGDRKLAKEIRRTKSKITPMNYVHHLPMSVNAEVFRGLRTSLFFKRNPEDKVFCITSPNKGDGKSTLTNNLSTSIAQSGQRVLLIDCDLRCPTAHKLLAVENTEGLTQVLNGTAEPMDVIQESEIENLSIMTTGGLPDNPAELLNSDEYRDLLGLMRSKYDLIILDCPPVLAVSDPTIVAPIADGTILLVNVKRTIKPEAVHAKEQLDSVGANVLGVVVAGGAKAFANEYRMYGYQYGQSGNSAYYGRRS